MEKRIEAEARSHDRVQRLQTIPGVGPITASALSATFEDVSSFTSARHFAAFLGLVCRQHSSRGKARLGGVSKMGNNYLRKLIVMGMRSALMQAEQRAQKTKGVKACWASNLKDKKHYSVAASAMANKTTRVVYAMLRDGTTYQDLPAKA